MGMTIAEKILAAHSDHAQVTPGEYLWCKVDGTGVIMVPPDLEKYGVDKVFDPDRVWVVEDHVAPSPTVADANNTVALRKWVKRYGITHWFEWGRHGILHQVFAENGYVVPGDLIISMDSHSTSYGCFNAMGIPVLEELVYVVITGELWLRVPQTIRFELTGDLPSWCVGKDVMLKLLGTFGTDAGIYKALEFGGPVVRQLSLGSRFSISNMGVEMGAKCAIFEADEKVYEFLNGRIWREPKPVSPDPDAVYEAVHTLDLTGLEPQVALPHDPGNVHNVSEVADMRLKIDQAYLGSCTNARLEDIAVAAQIMKGQKVHPDVRFVITPASQEIWRAASKAGYWDTLAEAGCLITNSTCGACLGMHMGVLGDGERCISTTNRNFQGRMGSAKAEVLLASPATVAASAISGYVSDPRPFLD
jgi:3-isopropylmalate/(R)-2-methylmalate dehydratase large subunit